MPSVGARILAVCLMIFIFIISFVWDRVDSPGDSPGRQRAADHHAILQEDQRLGRPAERQVEVQLVLLGILQLSLRAGRAGRQDHHDAVCAEHVTEAHMNKSLLVVCHICPPILIPINMGLVGAARLELARLPAEVLETSVSANSTMLPHYGRHSCRPSSDHMTSS